MDYELGWLTYAPHILAGRFHASANHVGEEAFVSHFLTLLALHPGDTCALVQVKSTHTGGSLAWLEDILKYARAARLAIIMDNFPARLAALWEKDSGREAGRIAFFEREADAMRWLHQTPAILEA